MKYNKSEIMKSAWAKYNSHRIWGRKVTFADMLKQAWKEAKIEAAIAKRQAERAEKDAFYAIKEVEYVRAALGIVA